MAIKDNCFYFDISKQDKDSAIRYLLSVIIKSRDEEGFPSNSLTYDEDVNVYLAHLLFAFSLPEYHEMAEPYLSRDTSEVMKWVNETEDQTIRYFIFKINADNLLVQSAIFNDLENRTRRHFFKNSPGFYRELARLYYEQAAAYHKRIYRKKTGIGDVLNKMAYYFEAYQHLLIHVRRKYFNFVNHFRDQAFHGFMQQMSQYENENVKRIKMDEFLDCYGRWLESKDPALESKIINVVRELKGIDPDFHCDLLEKRFMIQGEDENEKRCA